MLFSFPSWFHWVVEVKTVAVVWQTSDRSKLVMAWFIFWPLWAGFFQSEALIGHSHSGHNHICQPFAVVDSKKMVQKIAPCLAVTRCVKHYFTFTMFCVSVLVCSFKDSLLSEIKWIDFFDDDCEKTSWSFGGKFCSKWTSRWLALQKSHLGDCVQCKLPMFRRHCKNKCGTLCDWTD